MIGRRGQAVKEDTSQSLTLQDTEASKGCIVSRVRSEPEACSCPSAIRVVMIYKGNENSDIEMGGLLFKSRHRPRLYYSEPTLGATSADNVIRWLDCPVRVVEHILNVLLSRLTLSDQILHLPSGFLNSAPRIPLIRRTQPPQNNGRHLSLRRHNRQGLRSRTLHQTGRPSLPLRQLPQDVWLSVWGELDDRNREGADYGRRQVEGVQGLEHAEREYHLSVFLLQLREVSLGVLLP